MFPFSHFLNDIASALPTVVRETYDNPVDTRHFVHGLMGIQTMYDDDGTKHLLQDRLGSVRVHSNPCGLPIYAVNYLPYGAATGDHGFGFTGEYTDPNSLLFLRARHYDPNRALFLSRDSVAGDAMMPMSMNRYSYLQGNPLRLKRPGIWNQLLKVISS